MKSSILLALCFFSPIQMHKVVFDIPSLRNKSMIEIKHILGKPKLEDVPPDYKTKSGVTGEAFFEKDGFTLDITYNPVNNKVNDFFIGMDNAVGDYKMLEEAGNLLKSNDFILNPVKSNKNPSLYTGVTATPK